MTAPVATRRRTSEWWLGFLAVLMTAGGFILVLLSRDTKTPEGGIRSSLPADLWIYLVAMCGLFIAATMAVRKFAPRADTTLLPLALALNGFGWVFITRLAPDVQRLYGEARDLGRVQAVWTGIGLLAFVATLALVRHTRTLERFRYTLLLIGVITLALPALPAIGSSQGGARLWVQIGPVGFQPGEIAKVLLILFLAAYLVDKRELLATSTRRIGFISMPDPKHLGPLILIWIVSLGVLIFEKDLGSSLLFFSVFLAMVYVATGRAVYPVIGFLLFLLGAYISYRMFGHVRIRVETWIDPRKDPQNHGYQLLQSLFSFGTGGFSGTGLGLGTSAKIPAPASDFIFAAVGEEIGFLGTTAVIIMFMLLVGSAFRIAIRSTRPFSQLLGAGLAAALGIQTFLIVGGVTRVIPLTGITLPFVSYGGSSLVANYVILAILLRISDETATARAA